MKEFLIRWLVTSLAVLGATWIVPGVTCDGNGTVLIAALLLGIINALIRPILLLLSVPFIIVTMGFFILVINALLILLVSKIIPGFHVNGFWSALFAGIVIGFFNWFLGRLFRIREEPSPAVQDGSSMKPVYGRVVSEDSQG
ncbi:MAG: phage holin family protein [Verrucomicrobiota bacterium]